jgi:hypothetical protein
LWEERRAKTLFLLNLKKLKKKKKKLNEAKQLNPAP